METLLHHELLFDAEKECFLLLLDDHILQKETLHHHTLLFDDEPYYPLIYLLIV